jgi:hypothetical protein
MLAEIYNTLRAVSPALFAASLCPRALPALLLMCAPVMCAPVVILPAGERTRDALPVP